MAAEMLTVWCIILNWDIYLNYINLKIALSEYITLHMRAVQVESGPFRDKILRGLYIVNL